MKNLSATLNTLQKMHPNLQFVPGDTFVWSSSSNTITYINIDSPEAVWALVHETSHARLGHTSYNSDQHLLKMELEAWQEAAKLAKTLGFSIDQEHIEDCLDTYRDWLHKRSSCPGCGVVTLQGNLNAYKCFNCQTTWNVPSSPLCKITKKKQVSLSRT